MVELRQYTLRPQNRDLLIDLFDREFVETQEVVGMRVMGQFRDLDDPDRFIWLRGFADMPSRKRGLEAFYGGAVWAAHRAAANSTMIDSGNVLLLRPAWPGSGIVMNGRTRAAHGAAAKPAGLFDVHIFYLHEAAAEALLELCRRTLSPGLARSGAQVLGWYVTETTPNNFPSLPVREGEHVLASFAMFNDLAGLDTFVGSGSWMREAQQKLSRWLARSPESHRLAPTARSALHA